MHFHVHLLTKFRSSRGQLLLFSSIFNRVFWSDHAVCSIEKQTICHILIKRGKCFNFEHETYTIRDIRIRELNLSVWCGNPWQSIAECSHKNDVMWCDENAQRLQSHRQNWQISICLISQCHECNNERKRVLNCIHLIIM